MITPRWIFGTHPSEAELAAKETTTSMISDWWREFNTQQEKLEGVFSGQIEWDLQGWMNTQLHAIHPSLMWEFGPAVHGPGHRLVITPESEVHLRPLVNKILIEAPVLDNWEFYPYRLTESAEVAEQSVQARTETSMESIWVKVSILPSHHFGLAFHSPDFAAEDDQLAFNTVFVAVESLLGEETLDKWIGPITVHPVKSARAKSALQKSLKRKDGSGPVAGAVHIHELNALITDLIVETESSLPDTPVREAIEDADWHMYNLDPPPARDDYSRRYDLISSVTMMPAMWESAHGPGYFYSERYSKLGEIFCYVKIDDVDAFEDCEVDERSDLEEALNEELVSAEIGCCMGSGTGLRYAYIDLAIEDMDSAVPIIRKVLQAAAVPTRSWIHFYDSHWSTEWIGVYETSPAPLVEEADLKTDD